IGANDTRASLNALAWLTSIDTIMRLTSIDACVSDDVTAAFAETGASRMFPLVSVMEKSVNVIDKGEIATEGKWKESEGLDL
ncbi:hypothetical protein BVRB_021620, partial [Beta vulgaris subsp. vulgaris]